MTVLEVLRRASGYLQTHGSTSPRLDAELLLAHALGLRRLDLYLQHDRPLKEAELAPYRELTRRRSEGQPVAYLTGTKEFMALDFEVTPAVLVPNSDTELLVQRAVSWGRDRGGDLLLADVGTGSGAVGVAVAHSLPGATVHATDIDPEALSVASRNVARHHLEERVLVSEGDLLAASPSALHAVLANLPYLPDRLELPPEVTAQPALALRGGVGGGELVERLLREAPHHLVAGGVVLAEADPLVMEGLVAVAGRLYAGVRVHRDLRGHERLLEAWKG